MLLKNYIPELQGLRGICILLVVLSHAGNGFEKVFPGGLGVNLFFVLSGFLITRQLREEVMLTHTLALGHFYAKRVLRLLPPLLLYLIIFVPLLGWLGVEITGLQIVSGLFYVANYYHIFVGYPLHNPLPILWSLSVEDHFYLLFPFMIVLFRRKKGIFIIVMTGIVIAELVWRVMLYPGAYPHRLQGTDAIFDLLLYGAMSILLYEKIPANKGSFLFACIMLALSLGIRNELFRETFRYSLQGTGGALLIVNLAKGTDFRAVSRLLTHPFMLFMGKISYSLYLFHFGILVTIEAISHTNRLEGTKAIALYLLLSLLSASFSYGLSEKPFDGLRKKLKNH